MLIPPRFSGVKYTHTHHIKLGPTEERIKKCLLTNQLRGRCSELRNARIYPERRRQTFCSVCFAFGPRSSLFVFLTFSCFYVCYVVLCVLWVLCGSSKATLRCCTSICDGIILCNTIISENWPFGSFRHIKQSSDNCTMYITNFGSGVLLNGKFHMA